MPCTQSKMSCLHVLIHLNDTHMTRSAAVMNEKLFFQSSPFYSYKSQVQLKDQCKTACGRD